MKKLRIESLKSAQGQLPKNQVAELGTKPSPFLNFNFGIIVESHPVVRNNTESPCTLYPLSLRGNSLQNCDAVSQPGY